MELERFTDEELLEELADRDIEAKTIDKFTNDELIDELNNRHLTYSQENELLDIADHDCADESTIDDFDDSELIYELNHRGVVTYKADNLMEEQKINLMFEQAAKLTYFELEALFKFAHDVKKI